MNTIKLVENDEFLKPFENVIKSRIEKTLYLEKRLTNGGSLVDFANGYNFFGLHHTGSNWIFREWAPAAKEVFFIGEFSDWQPREEFKCKSIDNGCWELTIDCKKLNHGDLYKLFVVWHDGAGERIPVWATRVVQNVELRLFDAQVWHPKDRFEWQNTQPRWNEPPLIYEAHVGMSAIEGKVATFNEFTKYVIPRVVEAGYNTIQLMAIQEHPFYGSFGYHVSSFFAPSSRFGTPEDLKNLIDTAHAHNLKVIMDIVHSHAVKNEIEGLSRFDGTLYQYFHDGERGNHTAWDSRCFNYGKDEVLHFLLSNCKYWLEEFRFDGYRFDGVTSMLYHDHGLGSNFLNYEQYYNLNQDEDAISYLTLANKLIHDVNPYALTIAEEMSGMPGLASPIEDGGIGFDYRLAMGTPDFWIKQIKDVRYEFWHVGDMFYNLSNKRNDEKVIGYAESHDQALVGDQTIIFRLIGADMYDYMHKFSQNNKVDMGIALHKMIRLITVATAGNGYLNFMGNEFGHPEWIDFPRAENNWSFHYARRQWHLLDDKDLKYHFLGDFDKDFINIIKQNAVLLHPPQIMVQNIDDQVLIFERAGLIFLFNFSPNLSYTDYGFVCPEGQYKILLNADASKYGGYNRVDDNMLYPTNKYLDVHQLKMYLPSYSAFIIKKI